LGRASRIDNPDIIPLAVYQLGGSGAFVDVEDIFLRCYQLAPERFRWRKHDIPNYKTLAKALRDFEGSHPSFLVKTSDGLSRQLSAEGHAWVTQKSNRFEEILTRPGANPPTRRRDHRILNEFSSNPLMRAFVEGNQPNLVKHEVADLLLCAPDSPKAVWRERLETYRSAAADAARPELVEFLEFLRKSKPEWFGEAIS
jgi:hypothetical protein